MLERARLPPELLFRNFIGQVRIAALADTAALSVPRTRIASGVNTQRRDRR